MANSLAHTSIFCSACYLPKISLLATSGIALAPDFGGFKHLFCTIIKGMIMFKVLPILLTMLFLISCGGGSSGGGETTPTIAKVRVVVRAVAWRR